MKKKKRGVGGSSTRPRGKWDYYETRGETEGGVLQEKWIVVWLRCEAEGELRIIDRIIVRAS